MTLDEYRRSSYAQERTPQGRFGTILNLMDKVHVIYHHEPDGWWAESPDIDRWYAAGATYAEVHRLACEGVPFALGREVGIEHEAPAGERLSA